MDNGFIRSYNVELTNFKEMSVVITLILKISFKPLKL